MAMVRVKLSNGFGNNLFQYIYARLLAESHAISLVVKLPHKHYYGAKELKRIIPNFIVGGYTPDKSPTITITKNNGGLRRFLKKEYHNRNFDVSGHFENFLIYKNHISLIKSWFTQVKKTNNEDLVFHLRLGDRLFYKNSYMKGMKVEPDKFIETFNKFKFKKLHIVTDMKVWDYITAKQASKMKFHTKTPPSACVKPQVAVKYMNSLVEAFKPFNPVVRINKSISSDFDYIRSFDKILFQHGTLAWWAAAISDASKVGVYGPWRPVKGKKNKNLGKADFPGWFSWS